MRWDEDLSGHAIICLECMELYTGVQFHALIDIIDVLLIFDPPP